MHFSFALRHHCSDTLHETTPNLLKKMPPPPPEIILTSSPDGLILAFDSASGAVLARFTGSRSPRKGLALVGHAHVAASHISPDTGIGSVHLYNWWSSSAFSHLPVPEPVAPLAATADGLFLFAGGVSGLVHVLSLPSGDMVRSFSAHEKPVSCLEISFDGSLLLSGGDDGDVIVFPIFKLVDSSTDDELESPVPLHRFTSHTLPVTAITCGASGCNATIISCSMDCTCMFWSLLQGTLLRTVAFQCPIFGVAVDSTDTEFYAGGADGLVYTGAMKTATRQGAISRSREVVALTQQHGGAVMSVVLTNGGRSMVTASEDGSVWVWDVERGWVARVLGEGIGSVSGVVVAKGRSSAGKGKKGGGEMMRMGFTGSELNKPVSEITGTEDMLSTVVKDRSKSINILESAIHMYETLLELILKEAKEGRENK